MCGIAGIFRGNRPPEECVQNLRFMLAQLRHRGPDEVGYYFDNSVAMGTARLSIVDMAAGQQPIGDAQRRYWISFNGEIYNYLELRRELLEHGIRFKTLCDTEVLLYAWIVWGESALAKLNGAFAFAIYDKWERSLVLARDRFGKRPLYYAQDGDGVIYGSEMKCFIGYPGWRFQWDPEQVASIFRVWTPLGDQSGYRRAKQVPAGAVVTFVGDRSHTTTYAQLELKRPPAALSEDEAAIRIKDSLRASVRRRMMGDAASGVYLSGGVDSAIIGSIAAEQASAPLKTYSVSFESGEFDESADQRMVSSYLKSDHTVLRVTDADIVHAFPSALRHAEVPVFRTAFVPMFLLSRRVAETGVKVVLTGEGADEVFLGYDLFKETLLRSAWADLSSDARHGYLSRLYPYFSHFSEANRASLYSLFSRLAPENDSQFLSHDLRFRNSQLTGRLLRQKRSGLDALAALMAAEANYSTLSITQRAQWLECKTLLGGYLLSSQGDRMCAAHGVENRCPFLDVEVVAAGAETNLRFDDGWTEKYLLRRAFVGCVPDHILNKHKYPYRAPDARAFFAVKPDYLDCVFSESELKKVELFDPAFCQRFSRQLSTKPLDGFSQADNQAFMFLLSTVLLNEMFVNRGAIRHVDLADLLVREIDGRSAA